jgi:pimeloyl-ACP methyl ester carboxylesterase
MSFAEHDGVQLHYEVMGDDGGEPLLLVMGFTAQLTAWPDGFCQELVDHGFRVIRFDNRDCGLSSKTEGPPPDAATLFMRALAGDDISGEAPYTLSHMAADGMAVLDALGIQRAHVVGASMGGMIVQTMAFEHPERLLSATSIMSTTGNPAVGQAEPAVTAALFTPPPPDREAAIAHAVKVSQQLSGPLWDEGEALVRVTNAYDRSFHPIGAAFQLTAIAASGDRTERLRTVDLPFLVVHGRLDPLITLSGGLATAEAVPRADLLVLGLMGHNLPQPYWQQVADSIAALSRRGALSTSR